MHWTALDCTLLHFNALHYTVMQYSALNCTALHHPKRCAKFSCSANESWHIVKERDFWDRKRFYRCSTALILYIYMTEEPGTRQEMLLFTYFIFNNNNTLNKLFNYIALFPAALIYNVMHFPILHCTGQRFWCSSLALVFIWHQTRRSELKKDFI